MGLFGDIFGAVSDVLNDSMYPDRGGFTGAEKALRRATEYMNKRSKGRSTLMFLLDDVIPTEGSIVCCLLAGVADHSGVYVGSGRIIHRDGGGYIDEVSPREFLEMLNGGNAAVTIFVACKGKNPTGSRKIAGRAEGALNDPRHEGCNPITKNCHKFWHYCLTGKINNGITDFTFTALEDEMMSFQGMDTWRRLEFD